jgi:hypothetical protein
MDDDVALKGFPLRMRFGESTGLFLAGDELRIGYYEPGKVAIVLSTRDGNFPIRVYEHNGEPVLYDTWDEAKAALPEAHAIGLKWVEDRQVLQVGIWQHDKGYTAVIYKWEQDFRNGISVPDCPIWGYRHIGELKRDITELMKDHNCTPLFEERPLHPPEAEEFHNLTPMYRRPECL